MSEDFGPNFITLTDEDGNEFELEYIDALEVDGQTYMAFFPAVEEDEADEEDLGLVIRWYDKLVKERCLWSCTPSVSAHN